MIRLIISGFLKPLHSLRELRAQEGRPNTFSPNVNKAIDKGISSFEYTKNVSRQTPLISDSPFQVSDVVFFENSVNIYSWLIQLTAALVYDAHKAFDPNNLWLGAEAWSPNFIQTDNDSPIRTQDAQIVLNKFKELIAGAERSFDWVEGWSDKKKPYPSDIYHFSLLFDDPETPHLIIFLHNFYSQYKWLVWFEASQSTIAALKRKTGFVK